jgi:seryl-tRNA synthetase
VHARDHPEKVEEPMKIKHKQVKVAAGLVLAFAVGACDRAAVREEVQELKRTKNEVAAEVKEQLKSAKAGAEELKEELPSRERVREQIVETAHDVKDVAEVAGAKVKEQALKARDEIRENTTSD